METHELEKNKIEALSALSSLNMRVSEAHNALSKLKEEEKTYLAEREGRFMERIAKILEESEDVLKEAGKNYDEVKSLVQIATDFTQFIVESVEEIKEVRIAFEENTKLFDESVKRREGEIEELRKSVKLDRTQLENDKKTLESNREALKREKKKVQDERGVIERAINRLKEGRI